MQNMTGGHNWNIATLFASGSSLRNAALPSYFVLGGDHEMSMRLYF